MSSLNLWGQAARTLSGEAQRRAWTQLSRRATAESNTERASVFLIQRIIFTTLWRKQNSSPLSCQVKYQGRNVILLGYSSLGLHTSLGSWIKRTHLYSNILAFVFVYLLTSPNAKYIIKQTQHRATPFEYLFASFLVSDCLFIYIYYSSKHWYLKLRVKRLNANSYLSKRNTRILSFLKKSCYYLKFTKDHLIVISK